jgi:hypothetical protein
VRIRKRLSEGFFGIRTKINQPFFVDTPLRRTRQTADSSVLIPLRWTLSWRVREAEHVL